MTKTTDAGLVEQYWAMALVLRHQCAGYHVSIKALGEDGSDGYEIETESRSGKYILGGGGTIPLACVSLANGLT